MLPRLAGAIGGDIEPAVTAWIEVDREAEAERLRAELLAAGRPAVDEQRALLEIEACVESASRERLAGAGTLDTRRALARLRSKLGL